MKRLFVIIIAFSFVSPIFSQTVSVKKYSERDKGTQVEGFQTDLEGKKDDVAGAWVKYLKDVGKLKQNNSPMTLTEPAIGGTIYTTGIIYTDSKEKNEHVNVWVGIKEAEWSVNDFGILNRELEQLVYRFGVKFYRDKIQLQIDEAQRAFDAVEKQQQRTVNQNKDLSNKLVNNEEQKIQLEKSLEVNKLDHAVLLQKLEDNRLSQDSLAIVNVQIKKVIEMHKERQRKVN